MKSLKCEKSRNDRSSLQKIIALHGCCFIVLCTDLESITSNPSFHLLSFAQLIVTSDNRHMLAVPACCPEP